MRTSQYRLVVLGCALSWFLVGMHVGVLHEITHHHRMPPVGVLTMVLLLVALGAVTLTALLRSGARAQRTGP